MTIILLIISYLIAGSICGGIMRPRLIREFALILAIWPCLLIGNAVSIIADRLDR